MPNRMKPLVVAAIAGIAAGTWLASEAGAAEVTLKLDTVAEGLTHPLLLVEPPDGTKRKFVIEQPGVIRIIGADGKLVDEPFLNIRERIPKLTPDFDERGLLGLAFHPDYRTNGKFYIAYSNHLSADADLGVRLWYSHTNVVSEFQVSKASPNKADASTERQILRTDWPQFNHNGHWIGFGPDGFLYISMGDGGYANDWGIGHNVTLGNGQDLRSLNGKVLRIDVNGTQRGKNYAIPADNPFVGRTDALPEIWAYGFRNPWRCSFDMGGSRQLFCADVGQNSYEEVNIVTKGGNFGWRVKEATHCFDYANPNKHPATCKSDGMIDPIIEYQNCNVFEKDCKGLSITGGYVYRGKIEALKGKYIFGDWSKQFAKKDGRLYVGTQDGGKWRLDEVKVSNMPNFNAYVLAFGQDSDGEVYVMATDITGPVGGQDRIYRVSQ
ncbi:MAG: PQQ-dependent sugar dehydrogenase [Alphaproteobacteria bacterium]|nr:PQQ-dependent sugar dehydrogenase [Alphaproteobacteria bacterium]